MATRQTHERIRDLLDKGFTVLEISHHLRISPTAIYKAIKVHGFTKPSDRRVNA